MKDGDGNAAELIAEHYQNTFELTFRLWKQRNREFLILLGVIAASALLTWHPAQASGLLVKWVNHALGFEDKDETALAQSLPFGLVQSVSSIVVFYLMASLYHRSITVLRHYKYLAQLEGELRTRLQIPDESWVFTRESTFYWATTRTKFMQRLGWVYSGVLAIVLATFLYERLKNDWQGGLWPLLYFDAAVGFLTLAYFYAYATARVTDPQRDEPAARMKIAK
jgi:hypothetical protein